MCDYMIHSRFPLKRRFDSLTWRRFDADVLSLPSRHRSFFCFSFLNKTIYLLILISTNVTIITIHNFIFLCFSSLFFVFIQEEMGNKILVIFRQMTRIWSPSCKVANSPRFQPLIGIILCPKIHFSNHQFSSLL